MANKYAVASGLWSATSTWSDTDGGAAGAAVPADGDAVFILINVSVQMDADLSAYTGLFAVTIRGHATTPAMLYFKDGTSGYLKVRTAYNIVGTSGAANGRLLANSDGVWGNTTALAFANKAVIDLGATSKIDAQYLDIALYCTQPTNKSVRVYGQVFAEATVSAAANTLTYTGIAAALPNATLVRVSAGSGALPAELAAATDYWVVGASGDTIQLATTSGGATIDLSAGGPINVHMGWYANWGVSGNTLTKTTHGLANGVPVRVRSSGTLPTPLAANTDYYVVSTAAGAISLASVSGGTAITLGGSPSGTLDVYTGSTGAAASGGIGGTNPYTTAMVNVLDDVTADTPWTTATGHNRAVLANAGPQSYDQQRLTLSTITASTMTLSASVDSVQYPGARVYLISRNVSVRSSCTTGVNIIDYASAGTSSGVFQCEINSTAGTGTTFYGNGIFFGTGHTVSGTVSGCSNGIYYGTGHTVSGTVSGCTYGVNYGTGHTVSGTVSGCTYGVAYGTGHTVSGTVSGCTFGVAYGPGHTVSGTVSGCTNGIYYGTGHTVSGTVSGCSNGIIFGTGHTVSGTVSGCTNGVNGSMLKLTGIVAGCTNTFRLNSQYEGGQFIYVYPQSTLPTTPTYQYRNIAGVGTLGSLQGVLYEDYNQVLGASYAAMMMGDLIKNTATVRTGGATSSIETIPLSNCATTAPLRIFEWTELSVPASAQNKSVYMRPDAAWSVYPTNTELYIEAEYISNATTFATTVVKSTAVLNHASNWIQFTIPEFTPATAGHVRYRGYLKKYEASRKIYCDNMLVTA